MQTRQRLRPAGTLYTVSAAARADMLVTLALFVAGSVLGSISLPTFLNVGGIDPVPAGNYFGPWGGLAVTLSQHRACCISGCHRRPPTRRLDQAQCPVHDRCRRDCRRDDRRVLAGGHPWQRLTFGYTVWGAKLAT